ncbi:MAG: peptide ABC transporter substrate-binding protein [Opitutaceae bacterium]|nr:peptide ABC transporter substrate-binding protein [Opitutaceae bacterium]
MVRHTYLRAFLAALLALAAATLLTACGKKTRVAEQPAGASRVLVRGNATEPESLDPQVVRGQVEWTIVGGLFEGLVVPDPATMEPRPGVAETWEMSPDARIFTFHLRNDATWSDGRPVTAHDFLFAAERMLSPSLGSALPEDTLFFVQGARAFQSGTTRKFSDVGIRVSDTNTIVFILPRPTPFFASALFNFYPVRRDVIERHGAPFDRSTPWAEAGKLVGNGPFVLTEWTHGRRIVLSRRADYWDSAKVALDAIHFLPMENAQAEESAFRTGQLHMTFTVPFSKLETYRSQPKSPLREVSDKGIYFYTVNIGRNPVSDVRIRRALSLAIDREQLARVVLRGAALPATRFTPPGIGDFDTGPLLRHDPEEARRLLAEAGYPGGAGLPPVEVLFDSREYHRMVAEVVQQMWKRTLGIQTILRNHETQVVIASKNSMDFLLSRGWWNASSYQDPYFFLGSWKTGALYNEAKWSNPRFDAEIEASWTADPVARSEAFRRAETILLEELPVIPLFYSSSATLVSPRVKGLIPKPFADRRLKELSLE